MTPSFDDPTTDSLESASSNRAFLRMVESISGEAAAIPTQPDVDLGSANADPTRPSALIVRPRLRGRIRRCCWRQRTVERFVHQRRHSGCNAPLNEAFAVVIMAAANVGHANPIEAMLAKERAGDAQNFLPVRRRPLARHSH